MIILRQKEFGRLVGKAKANVNNFFTGGNKKPNKKIIRDYRINEVLDNKLFPNSRDFAVGEFILGKQRNNKPHTDLKTAAIKVSRGSDYSYKMHLNDVNPNLITSDYQGVVQSANKYYKYPSLTALSDPQTINIDKKILLNGEYPGRRAMENLKKKK